MNILAIDPGTMRSAIVLYDPRSHDVLERELLQNDAAATFIDYFANFTEIRCAIEMVASYGMPVGREVFDTVAWIGRFERIWFDGQGLYPERVFRKDVKMRLCGTTRAKDANIRQALLDAFPATGGGKTPQVGTKTAPGPLYGMKADMWAALAVAVTASSQGEADR